MTRVPLLVLTHLHADHVEGVPGLLRGRRVGEVEIGPLDEPVVERSRLLGWLGDRRVVRAQIGETDQRALLHILIRRIDMVAPEATFSKAALVTFHALYGRGEISLCAPLEHRRGARGKGATPEDDRPE